MTVTRGATFLPIKVVDGDALMITDSLGTEVAINAAAMRPHGLAAEEDQQPKARPMNVAPDWQRYAERQQRLDLPMAINLPKAEGRYLQVGPDGIGANMRPMGNVAVGDVLDGGHVVQVHVPKVKAGPPPPPGGWPAPAAPPAPGQGPMDAGAKAPPAFKPPPPAKGALADQAATTAP